MEKSHISPPKPPSSHFAERLRFVRRRRGWTQLRLSEEMQSLGFAPIDRTAIVRIERGVRNVSLDEAIGFAAALGVAPAALLLPSDNTPVALTPNVVLPSSEAESWLIGLFPLPQHTHSETERRFFYEASSDAKADVMRRFPGIWRLFEDVSLLVRSAQAHKGKINAMRSKVILDVLHSIQKDLPGVIRDVERDLEQNATKRKDDRGAR